MTADQPRERTPLSEPCPATDPRDDHALLRAHLDGDGRAFGELVKRHQDRLWAVALRTIGDREEAADALQDALLSAYRAAGRFRGDSAVTTWLHRIVVNACLDRIRRRSARPTTPLPEAGPAEPSVPDRTSERETSLMVWQALSRIPSDQRAALVLVDLHGYSVAEAAEILRTAAGTVKSRCSRGRARLAVILGHLGNPESTAAVPSSGGSAPLGAGSAAEGPVSAGKEEP
ncbi:MAG: RNA polymerase sigma factor SigM [Micromonosporaceae bacterium]|nr:RNA polymerase sigma factor SigM [Micromonosporaceae bacterium]